MVEAAGNRTRCHQWDKLRVIDATSCSNFRLSLKLEPTHFRVGIDCAIAQANNKFGGQRQKPLL